MVLWRFFDFLERIFIKSKDYQFYLRRIESYIEYAESYLKISDYETALNIIELMRKDAIAIKRRIFYFLHFVYRNDPKWKEGYKEAKSLLSLINKLFHHLLNAYGYKRAANWTERDKEMKECYSCLLNIRNKIPEIRRLKAE